MAKISKKLHEVASKDSLRTDLQHIIIEGGNFVVIDLHMLLIQPLKYHDFDDTEIGMLEGYCIHRDTFKELLKYDTHVVDDFGVITASKKGVEVHFELKKTSEQDWKYPRYKSVLPDGSSFEPKGSIGLDPVKLQKLSEAMVGGDFVELIFHERDKPIEVRKRDAEGQVAILMPVQIKP